MSGRHLLASFGRTITAGVAIAVGALALQACGGPGADRAANLNQVTIDSGTLEGVVDNGVWSFKGIPFAAAPVGDLRWRAPQPVAKWDGVRKADSYGHDCMQLPVATDAAPLTTEPSEDCLYLNVWRPAEPARDKLPVMVWIYGGGFVNGGTSPAVYDGSAFARKGVVLVSANYRLGRFGFFAFPGLTQEAKEKSEPTGNYAFMDQIAALKWVKANIAAFGGDPDNVTIFGESAGGISVLTLLTEPSARGLFNKAICESGGGRGNLMGMRNLSGPGKNDMPSAEAVGVALAKSTGVDGTDEVALAALRAVPADKILNGLNMMTMGQAGDTYAGGPILDGQIVTNTPSEILEEGIETPVPFLMGANSADIGFNLAKSMDQVLAPFGSHAEDARKIYDPEATGDAQKVGAQVAMDRIMVEPVRFVAKLVASHGQPAYAYRFSYVAKSMRDQWAGAPHASEIPYVFDTVAAKYGKDVAPEDEAIADAANAYWVNFAKTGDPNGEGLPRWPAVTSTSADIMDFTETGPVGGPDPWKARLDLITETASSAN
jgi:para-nitrobenzyl esterase